MASLFDGAHPGLKEALDRSYQRQLDNGVKPKEPTDVEKLIQRLRARFMDTKQMLPCELEHKAADALAALVRERDEARLQAKYETDVAAAEIEGRKAAEARATTAEQACEGWMAKCDGLERQLGEARRALEEAVEVFREGPRYGHGPIDKKEYSSWRNRLYIALTEKPAAAASTPPEPVAVAVPSDEDMEMAVMALCPHPTTCKQEGGPCKDCEAQVRAVLSVVQPTRLAAAPVPSEPVSIEHDGFTGTVIGHYVTREGKRGVVLQQIGTRVVHVYGEKWLSPSPSAVKALDDARAAIAKATSPSQEPS